MQNVNMLSSIDMSAAQRYCVLENIEAIELMPSATAELCPGPILTIPEGAEIEPYDAGFDDQTMKVRWRGKLYFVFRDDLPMPAQ